jgi:hypothetical protein
MSFPWESIKGGRVKNWFIFVLVLCTKVLRSFISRVRIEIYYLT